MTVAVVLVSATALAQPKAETVLANWSTGMVTAVGVGLADREAPNPAVARGTSRRKAEESAKRVLEKEVARLPLAGGGTVADKLGDDAVKKRIDRAVEDALTVSADPETDGAWVVTLAVPTEAVRQAVFGVRALDDKGDAGPAVMVIDGVTATPSIGVTVGGIAAATLWVNDVPAWAKDAPHAKATTAAANAQTATDIPAKIGKATASTLFVLVRK
ncbi:MAG TPA: hypothetical protein VGM90_31950 [Kofleriaceae bacterium]|jgi:hypothetical protein